jgi:hypothetical protein
VFDLSAFAPGLDAYLRGEPERSRRVLRLLAANDLAWCDRSASERPLLAVPRLWIYEADPSAPPAAIPEERRLPAERLVHVQEAAGSGNGSRSTVYVYSYEIPPTEFEFEHDVQKRAFRVRSSDGEVSVFRDRPVRYLVVRPDPKRAS